jgi:hypothetical protein
MFAFKGLVLSAFTLSSGPVMPRILWSPSPLGPLSTGINPILARGSKDYGVMSASLSSACQERKFSVGNICPSWLLSEQILSHLLYVLRRVKWSLLPTVNHPLPYISVFLFCKWHYKWFFVTEGSSNSQWRISVAKDGSIQHPLAYWTQSSQCRDIEQDGPSTGDEELRSQPCPEGIPV